MATIVLLAAFRAVGSDFISLKKLPMPTVRDTRPTAAFLSNYHRPARHPYTIIIIIITIIFRDITRCRLFESARFSPVSFVLFFTSIILQLRVIRLLQKTYTIRNAVFSIANIFYVVLRITRS
jgi:hypothetical protein